MGIPKMHLLDHVCSDIRRNGGFQYIGSSYFEQSHVSVKENYRGSLRRRSSVVDQTDRNFERSLVFKLISGSNSRLKGVNRKRIRRTTFNDVIASLVRRGKQFTNF